MTKSEATIKAAIEGSKSSRYRLAKDAGVSESLISRFMSGQRGMGFEPAEKLAEALGLEIIIRPKQAAGRKTAGRKMKKGK